MGMRGSKGGDRTALDRRLEFCITAEEVVDLLPAVVICIGHSFTFHL
jgi:hypothetical protein